MSNKNKQVLVSSIALVALVAITVGVSYAFFNYSKLGSKVNTVTTGVLSFAYTEATSGNNGVSLTNAMPKSDNDGKIQIGATNAFDFTVTASASGATIDYSIAAIKQGGSSLPENTVKVYLTDVTGTETPAPLTVNGGAVRRYSELGAHSSGGKTLYTGSFGAGTNNVTKTFRLRMWLASDATAVSNGSWNYNGQTFQVKIGVYAN
ncbi:MAG: hypothetical protein RR406_02105 [Bacilli bacterium]